MVERLNQEIRRRERVIRIFPNVESAIRLLGAFLLERYEDWMTDRRYMNMTDYLDWRKHQKGKTSSPGKQVAAD